VTETEYCSQVCKAQCCKAPWILAKPCQKLGPDNLCTIYEDRLKYLFLNTGKDGRPVKCNCAKPEVFLSTLPPEVKEQCCFHNPSVLEGSPLRGPVEN